MGNPYLRSKLSVKVSDWANGEECPQIEHLRCLLVLSKAQDTDLEATSTIMSLKCPLSTLRMETPCRSSICTHNQCFDALSFLQLQQQGPTWMCPVCNRTVTFEALQIDQ